MKYIIGQSSFAESVSKQYNELGFETKIFTFESLPQSLDSCDELFVTSPETNEAPLTSDSLMMSAISPLLDTYKPENNGGQRLLCHIQFLSRTACDTFLTTDLKENLNSKIEFWPFTLADIYAQNINFAHKRISVDSDQTVHLVVYGMTERTETIIKYAILSCHYPNYCRNHSLRTRITVIDENLTEKAFQMCSRYSLLLENSYVRRVDVNRGTSHVSKPMFPEREDFIDIEWEFVDGRANHADIKQKMKYWASCNSQQLCVVIGYDNDEKSLAVLNELKQYSKSTETPIYIYLKNSGILQSTTLNDNIHLIADDNVNYDVRLPLRRMAQMVNYIYSECYNASTEKFEVPLEIDKSKMQLYWEKCLHPMLRWSSVCNAMSIKSKMLSLGHSEDDWETFYSMTAAEETVMYEVEHNRWCVEKLLAGFRPLTDEERSAVDKDKGLKNVLKEQKAHYDLVAFSELKKDETGKNTRMYDECLTRAIPLIATLSKMKEDME